MLAPKQSAASLEASDSRESFVVREDARGRVCIILRSVLRVFGVKKRLRGPRLGCEFHSPKKYEIATGRFPSRARTCPRGL